jgi:hypothetical protein
MKIPDFILTLLSEKFSRNEVESRCSGRMKSTYVDLN